MKNKGKIHYAWFILAACCLLQTAILGIVQNCRGIFYDPVCSDLGLETSAFTLYSLFHGAASFLSMPLTTRFLDRVHPRIALLVTLTLFCGSTALMGSVSTLPAFYALGALQGVGGSLLIFYVCPFLINNWFDKRYGFAMGFYTAFSGLAGVVVNPLLNAVIEKSGWRTGFHVQGLMAFAVALPAVLIIRSTKPETVGLARYGESGRSAGTDPAAETAPASPREKQLLVLAMVFTALVSLINAYAQHLAKYALSIGLTNAVPDSYDSLRIDSRHQLSMPFKIDFVSLVPRVSWRGTYYSETRERYEEEFLDGTNTATRTAFRDAGGGMRSLFEIGAEASFKAYGFYDGNDGDIFRHVVEPYVDWSLIPEPSLRPWELYQFDSIDTLDKAHTVRMGVRQLVERKAAEGNINKLFDLDLYAIYCFEDANDESGMQYYGADCVWNISDNIKLDADALYDAFKDDFDHIDLWMSLWQGDRWEVAGECYFIPDDTTLFRGDIRCNLTDKWAVGFYTRYDSEVSRCEQISGYLQYSLDCISFRLRTAYEPSYTRDDGTEREAKLKISFNAWLRAFTPARYERRLRNGYWDD